MNANANETKMSYVIITLKSSLWVIVTIVTTLALLSAIVAPKWLIGPERILISESNFTFNRSPSVGIYTRCIMMNKLKFHCGAFDIEGFATDSYVYPTEWKIVMCFMSFGFSIMCLSIFLSLLTCCRQSILGKSIHNLAGSLQAIAGISIMISVFVYPLGWNAQRVKRLCGHDAESFYPAECSIGWAMYSAIISVVLCVLCASLSRKAESGNMRTRIKRRIEGGEKLVIVP